VIAGVEAGGLVMDRDREEDELDRGRAAHVALLRRRSRDGLEALEVVPVRAAVLIDRHDWPRTVPAREAGSARRRLARKGLGLEPRGRENADAGRDRGGRETGEGTYDG